LVIGNLSRRYVQATVELPPWLTTATRTIALIPGQQAPLALQAHIHKMPIIPRNVAVVVRAAGGSSVVVGIRGGIPSPRKGFQPQALLIIVAIWLVLCVVAVLLPMLQNVFGAR
jgi:hypothetical protein